jgi:hypothetical protein
MKRTRLLAAMVLIALTAFGYASPQGEGFAIYLLAHDIPILEIPTMSHLELADEPLISVVDIVSYSASTHEIELTAEAYRRIAALEVPVWGKAFAVCVDGHPVYWGAFWTAISSMSFDGVTILLPIRPEPHVIQLQLGYPESPELFKGEDPRGNGRILESLKQAGKLR